MSKMQGAPKPLLVRLTKRQIEAFNVLHNFQYVYKRDPSVQDIADALGLSRNPAYQRLKQLVKKGYATVDERGKFRTTREGVSQRIQDFTELSRVYKPKQDTSWQDARRDARLARKAPD